MMKKLIIVLVAILMLPNIALAAFNDVTFPQDSYANLSSDGATIGIDSTTVVASMTVNTADITFSVAANSKISIWSDDKRYFNVTGTNTNYMNVTESCSGDTNNLVINVWPSAPTTYTIVVNLLNSTCTGSPSGGGGGGGGGGYTPPATTEETTEEEATTESTEEAAETPESAPTASAPSTTDGSVTATSADGGTTQMTTDAGTVAKVIIPPAAIAADTTVTIDQVAVTETTSGGDTATAGSGSSVVASAPSGKAIVGGRAYTVNAETAEASVSSFSDSISITLEYTDSQIAGITESSLKVYYYNETDNSWTVLNSVLDTGLNKITAYVDHLTTFVILGTLTYNASAYEDKVIKSSDSAAVYLVNNGYRRAFTSEMMYFSYGFKWSDLVTMNISAIPEGPNMVYSDDHSFTAGQMVKGTNEKVYFMDNAGYRHWVENETAFLGLGYDWKQVAWISDSALAKYAEGTSIPTADTRPNGSLIKYSDSDKVYLIENGKKKWISSETTFNANSFGWYNIIVIPNTETFTTGSNI